MQQTVSVENAQVVPSAKTYPLWEILFYVWAVGAFALMSWIFWKNCKFLALVRKEKPLLESRWLALLQSCKEEMGVYTPIQIIETSYVKSPALMGFIRPRLLLPPRIFESMDENEIRMIFLHELIHLKRGDIIINWLISFIQVLHWFNPFVWLAFNTMRERREQACDESVISFIGSEKNRTYGNAIVKLLEFSPDISAVEGMACILEDKKQITRRMKMIKGFQKPQRGAIVFVLFLFSLTGFLFLSEAKEEKKESEAKKETDNSALQKKLKSIVIKECYFYNTELLNAMSDLSVLAKESDPEKKGVNIISTLPPEVINNTPPVNMIINDMPLGKVLEYVCSITGLTYKVDTYAVLILSPKEKKTMLKNETDNSALHKKKENVSITKIETGREGIELKDFIKLEAGSIRKRVNLDEYIATGNIEITAKSGTGKADKAFINIKDKVVVLKGNARFTTKNGVIEDEIIVLGDHSQKMEDGYIEKALAQLDGMGNEK